MNKASINAMKSSKSDQWNTPTSLAAFLAPYFPWDLDVCASEPNICSTFLTLDDDAFTKEWTGLWWMNPPYGREIPRWLEEASTQAKRNNSTGVCLIPARTDTRWFHTALRRASFTVLIKGRLTFGSRQSWIDRYDDRLASALVKKKSIKNIISRIGGIHINSGLLRLVEKSWPPGKMTFIEWLWKDYVKPESALFPSAIMAFGPLFLSQKGRLAELGTTINARPVGMNQHEEWILNNEF